MDIDLVYTWVDGSDPNHVRERQLCYKQFYGVDSNSSFRFRNAGEIYQSIQSAQKFAPWIRHIFVVVANDSQKQLFENGNTLNLECTLVTHAQIFSDAEDLPTFNSHSIEANLHNIPGLAEHFLYANDDTFFGTYCEPSLFFDRKGMPLVCFSKNIMIRSVAGGQHESFAWGRVNNSRLLDKLTRTRNPNRLEIVHQIRPMCKTFMVAAWRHPTISPYLQRTSQARFRSSTDLEPIGFVLHWKYANGTITSASVRSAVFSIDDKSNLDDIFYKIRTQMYQLYCVNDHMVVPSNVHLSRYQYLLEGALPHIENSTVQFQLTQAEVAKGSNIRDRTYALGFI